jgi:hypothetical protein
VRLDRWRCGFAFALSQRAGAEHAADVIGTLRVPPAAAPVAPHALRALRRLPPAAALDDEILALARHPLARWRARRAEPPGR